MKLFIDECVTLPTRKFLRQAGYRLVTIEELGRTSAPNGEVLSLAKQHKLPLVTADRDLGNLTRYPLGTHAGIIVLKLPRLPEGLDAVHQRLHAALAAIPPRELAGGLLIVDRNKYRLRRHA